MSERHAVAFSICRYDEITIRRSPGQEDSFPRIEVITRAATVINNSLREETFPVTKCSCNSLPQERNRGNVLDALTPRQPFDLPKILPSASRKPLTPDCESPMTVSRKQSPGILGIAEYGGA